MPIYDCGAQDCEECQRAFGLDRSKAIANYKAREESYARIPQPMRQLNGTPIFARTFGGLEI